ncbi:hypothetical protein LINPERHAP1_LOCUS39102, partial [Linum perenne]
MEYILSLINSQNSSPGATDHMTSSSLGFITYKPVSSNHKVKVADGSYASIAGKGNIALSNDPTLSSVLHVPKLTCNLLSIPKLTSESNCTVHFFPSYCHIQD